MKITLIKPNIGIRNFSGTADQAAMEPLQLGILAALTPPEIEVVLYDDRLEPIPYDDPTDLVCITVESFTALRSYEISRVFRDRGTRVLLGGMHVTLVPEEAAEHADSIMIGDAEDQWGVMLTDLKTSSLQPVYRCRPVDVPQAGVLTRRDLFDGKRYLPITLLQFSRGCPHQCSYCASSSYFHRHHYCRPVNEVVAEIKSQKRRLLFFVDDNIVADREKAKALFRALIPLKVKWVSQASLDMLEDDELMRLMVKSGCLGHVIGFESILPDSIREMGKTANNQAVQDHYRQVVARLRAYGLQTWAAFTLGHDSDTPASILATERFARRSKFTFAAYNILMPYPGTAFYDRLQAEGRLLYDGRWWLDPSYPFNGAAFRPKSMTAEKLTELGFACRRRFNSRSSILYRLFEIHTNLRNPLRFFTYLTYNPLFRKEVFEKQGMNLGYREDT